MSENVGKNGSSLGPPEEEIFFPLSEERDPWCDCYSDVDDWESSKWDDGEEF
ncbi:hypothetical protein [Actinoplanes derwentensis]|uniref:Uncharacterized protein n=1 Tax=Actinoplanes derwentensis TaxID=113562 RepID=A0A1H1V1N3_9ACTN|nr:hypothetical protein [Actinoplanes derwentensis]GID89829.1 hypothetical protein Ade03nite_87530 [Actinoplanes derwentensis]SDS78697.1 hypothetical protein SAMN04489716_1614 [Actinoplanes derwentensis]